MVQVSIEYDNERYSPGDTVSAKVSIHASKAPTKICCIKISVVGCAVVKWTERESKSATKEYLSTHTYLSRCGFVVPPPEEGKTIIFPIGTHIYFYKFSLYLSEYGKVKYKCTVDVIGPFRPLRGRTSEEKGSILRGEYIPGERVSINAFIYNRTPRTITGLQILLVEETTFIAFYKCRAYQRVKKEILVNTNQSLHVSSGSDYFYSRDIAIPRVTLIHNTCPYIKVKHYVKIRISTSSFFGTSLSLKLPLAIGSIPSSDSNPQRIFITPHEENVSPRTSRQYSDESFYYLSEESDDISNFNQKNPLTN